VTQIPNPKLQAPTFNEAEIANQKSPRGARPLEFGV
jgi:hypothetical protein